MRELKQINTDESISTGQLVFDEGPSDKFNRLAVYIIFSPFIFLPVVTYFKQNFANSNEIFLLCFVFPVSILFGLYIFYRNATELRLTKIDTNMDSQEIKKMFLEYADKNKFEVYRKSHDCLIFNETLDGSTTSYKKTQIFFIKDNLVLFALIRDNYKLNMPTLFSHLFLKRDLTKLLRKTRT